MKFSELEDYMASIGVFSLAEFARKLNTTPQAVSNWKSRDQVPNHIALKISNTTNSNDLIEKQKDTPPLLVETYSMSITDVIINISSQLKLIFLILFISNFFTFIHVYFIKQPIYDSWATVLLPDNKKTSSIGGLAGFATQFGVDLPSGVKPDLSSPYLFPELLKSSTFSEKLLLQEFYTKKYNEKLPLLAILNNGIIPEDQLRNATITRILGNLEKMIDLKQDTKTSFSIIKVKTFEPEFSKEMAEVVVSELEKLNKFFKSRTISEKTTFIKNRISSVEADLIISEQRLKAFKEQNRQANSPALELELERLLSEVEIHRGIFLTLKQQLELAKIEEIQESSIFQILDRPELPLGPSNKNVKISLIISTLFGLVFGVLLALIRSFIQTDDLKERRKMRKIKFLFKKKFKELLTDQRLIGTINIILILGSPYFLLHKSQNPTFFGIYSNKMMFLNLFYLVSVLFLSVLFIKNRKTP